MTCFQPRKGRPECKEDKEANMHTIGSDRIPCLVTLAPPGIFGFLIVG
jgi:hypothetical protein